RRPRSARDHPPSPRRTSRTTSRNNMNRACAARSSTFIEVVVGLGVVAGAVVVGAVAGVVAGIAAGVAGVVAGVVGGDDGHDGDVIGALLLLLRRWAATRVRRHDDRSRGPGLAWPAWTRWRAAEGGSGRRFLACLTVDRLVDHLLDWAARQIPEPFRERFAEEWQDHRTHRRGVR